MQWLLNAVLAVECLSMPFFAAGAVAGMVWYGGRRMGADWGWLAGGALASAGLFLAVWGWLRLRGRFSAGVIRRPFWMNSWGCMRR